MKHPFWLPEAVLYQIYPSSFCDSDGDGVGDLQGILSKLDYLRDLGVNVVWLSPIYDSPFRDGGYDVRNHYEIATRFGTMQDFEALLAAIHLREMRLILDLVPGHTSDEHPLFVESAKSQHGPYSDWFIWTESTFLPNEATGDFIKGRGQRNGNYLANFFCFQPALNYGYADPKHPWQLPTHHASVRAVREEMARVMRFWLEKGVDGFRVDMAHSLIKGKDPEAIRKANFDLWQEVRSWWDQTYPDALLLAEWSDPAEAIACGFHLDFMIHCGPGNGMKPFRGENDRTIIPRNDVSWFDRSGRGDLQAFFDEFDGCRTQIGNRGYISVPTGNHDLPRYSVRRQPEDLRLIQVFLCTLPHVPTIYYGDEIGMRHLPDVGNKEGGYERTGARTPMQWDASAQAGFSSADSAKLYLPVDPDPQRPNVAEQQADPESLLSHLKSLLKLRTRHRALGSRGDVRRLSATHYPLVYLRSFENCSALIAINPTPKIAEVSIAEGGAPGERLSGEATCSCGPNGAILIHLPALSYCIYDWKNMP